MYFSFNLVVLTLVYILGTNTSNLKLKLQVESGKKTLFSVLNVITLLRGIISNCLKFTTHTRAQKILTRGNVFSGCICTSVLVDNVEIII